MHPPIPILVNPAAGGGRALRVAGPVGAVFTEAGCPCEIVVSRGPGHLSEAAAEAARSGRPFVVALGGDGTLSEVSAGLLSEEGTDTALAPVAVGTGNDFVKTAGISRDWREASHRLAGTPRRRCIDAGRVNGRWFINGVGMGLDAAVAIGAEPFKRRVGVLGYVAGFAGMMWTGPRCPGARLAWDGGHHAGPVSLVTVCNGRYVGGLFHIAPGAELDDGRLSLVWADSVSRLEVLRYAPRVVRGTHLGLPVAHSKAVTRVTIEVDGPLPVQADGEIIDRNATRLEVEIAPGALALLG